MTLSTGMLKSPATSVGPGVAAAISRASSDSVRRISVVMASAVGMSRNASASADWRSRSRCCRSRKMRPP